MNWLRSLIVDSDGLALEVARDPDEYREYKCNLKGQLVEFATGEAAFQAMTCVRLAPGLALSRSGQAEPSRQGIVAPGMRRVINLVLLHASSDSAAKAVGSALRAAHIEAAGEIPRGGAFVVWVNVPEHREPEALDIAKTIDPRIRKQCVRSFPANALGSVTYLDSASSRGRTARSDIRCSHRVNGVGPWFTGDLPRTPAPRTARELGSLGSLMSSGVESIVELLGPREVIGQAVDVLIARDHVSRDAAYELLVQGSSRSQRKVREFAADIVGQREAE